MYDPLTGRSNYGTGDDNLPSFIQINSPGGQITGRLMRMGVQTIAQLWMNGGQITIRNQRIGPTDWYDIQ